MSTHQEPTYPDAVAVIAGLDRLIRDMADLRAETVAVDWQPLLPDLDDIAFVAKRAASDLRQDVRWGGRISPFSFDGMAKLHGKLAHLAGEIAGLGTGGQEVIHRQLAWLAGDVERMRAALAREENRHGS